MKVLNLADASDLVTHTNFICKYCGSRKKSGAGLPKGFHQCAIIKLAHQTRRQALVVQPAVDIATNRRVRSRQ